MDFQGTSDISYNKFEDDKSIIEGSSAPSSSICGTMNDATKREWKERIYIIIIVILIILNITVIALVARPAPKCDTDALISLIKNFKEEMTNNTDEIKRGLHGVLESTAGTELNILRNMKPKSAPQTSNPSNKTEVPDKEAKPASSEWKASGEFLYKIFEERVTFAEADVVCKSFGGRLAATILRDPASIQYIKQRNYGSWNDGTATWIGFSDIQEEGTWIWEDGGQMNPNTTNWVKGEPNNAAHDENCGGIIRNHEATLGISDESCSRKYYFICEGSIN